MSNLNRLGGACGAGALAALAFAGLAFGQDAPASPIPAPAFLASTSPAVWPFWA